jgi:hypothetical protein
MNPVCPYCDSRKVTKQGFQERNPIMGVFGLQTVHVQRYKCKNCNRKFNTPLDPIVAKNHQYASIFKDKANQIDQNKHRPLRKTSEDFQVLWDVAPSHQTIKNWLRNVKTNDNFIHNYLTKYSDYYCYDEQFININGIRYYRLSLTDFGFNVPVAEQISIDKGADTVKAFLKLSTLNKKLISITTDHDQQYKNIIDGLGAIHQLCIHHLFDIIWKEVKKALNSKLTPEEEKTSIKSYFKKIKNIFFTYDENKAVKRLESLLDDFEQIPKVLKPFIKDKIINDWQRLTQFMRNDKIPRTSNHVENYYRQTDPETTKKVYKTITGVIDYLFRKMDYWTRKFGHIQESTPDAM